MALRQCILLSLVLLVGCSKPTGLSGLAFDNDRPKIADITKYPWCEWNSEIVNGRPNGKGAGGCVIFRELPHVPHRRLMKEMPTRACDDESDECQCEKFWRTAVNLDYYIIYEGYYVDGVRSGEGSYLYPDGSLYIGQWEADRRHGYGVLFDFDCKVVERGDWVADVVR